MKTYYATLCLKHGNAAVKINAETPAEARKKMFEVYGDQWAFMYTQEEKAEAIDKFGTQIIKEL